jgi:hypothetical protein
MKDGKRGASIELRLNPRIIKNRKTTKICTFIVFEPCTIVAKLKKAVI